MEDNVLSRALRIDSPDQAAVFADPKRRRILARFMGRECSMSEAARALDVPLNQLAYHVSAFIRLGLLRVVREQKRAGRPIRFYRAVADEILVAAEAMRSRTGDALAAELRTALAEADHLSGSGDMLLSVDAAGRARMTRIAEDSPSDACEYWRVLHLGKKEARQLARDLADLFRSYEASPGTGRAAYLAHAALAPRRKG